MAKQILRPTFAVCVANEGCDDLSLGMLYRILPDVVAAKEELLRVVDDSGEDYLYSANRFVIVAVPETEESRLAAVMLADIG